MPFDDSSITSVAVAPDGVDLLVSWTSTAPAGTWFQVYLARQLVWWGTARSVSLPFPSYLGANVLIDVGTVGPGEISVDFSGTHLPVAPPDRAELTWYGGTWEAPDITGFHVYGSSSPGTISGYNTGGWGDAGFGFGGALPGVVDTSQVLGDVNAYTAGIVTDGFGFGAFGAGGWGAATGVYSWVSGHLAPGVWTFAVAAYDTAGNEDPSPPKTVVIVVGPPRPPAANSGGIRLTYTYDQPSRTATLHWLASPGY